MFLHNRVLIALAGLVLLVASCGTDDVVTDAPADPEEVTEEEVTEEAPDVEEDTAKRIIIGETIGVSFSRLPGTVTRDRLNEEGWEIETVHFSSEDLQVEAVASGTVHFARLQALDAIRIIQLGGDIINLASDRPDEFVAIAPADVQDCSEMEGARLAIHSEGSTYTHIYNYWLENVCDVQDAQRLVIAGGENRIVALMAAEVDGTNVALADFVTLDDLAPGEFRILANFGQQLDGLVGGMLLANKSWLEENRALAAEYVAELFKDIRDANEDGTALREAAEEHQSPEDVEVFDKVRQVYLDEIGGFPECGLVDREMVEDLIALFEELDMIEPGLTPDDVVDFSVLDDARERSGVC